MAGSFDRTMEAIEWANQVGLSVQINTTFSCGNVEDFDNIAALMETKNIALWSVFVLVPTGRGKIADLLSAEEFETVFAKLHRLSRRASFHIKTTEAQHYRRYVLQQQVAERRSGAGEGSCADLASDEQKFWIMGRLFHFACTNPRMGSRNQALDEPRPEKARSVSH